jgi:hypothetical protein
MITRVYLLQFILTSILSILSDCETVLLHLFDIIAEAEKWKQAWGKAAGQK